MVRRLAWTSGISSCCGRLVKLTSISACRVDDRGNWAKRADLASELIYHAEACAAGLVGPGDNRAHNAEHRHKKG